MNRLSVNSQKYMEYVLKHKKVKQISSLRTLYSQFESYYLDTVPLYQLTKQKPPSRNITNPFLTETQINEIKRLPKYVRVTFEVLECPVKLHLFYDRPIDTLIPTLVQLVQFFVSYTSMKRPIQIYYYLTDRKKKRVHEILTREEVNSGSTDTKQGKIYIWRREELFKTTFHELIHLSGLDSCTYDLANVYYSRYGLLSPNVSTVEAYTDFWAILLNLYFTTKQLDQTYSYFLRLYHAESVFVEYQARKILSLNRHWNRHTEVLSYYVLKAELFQSIQRTLKKINYQLGNTQGIDEILKQAKPLTAVPMEERGLRMSMIQLHIE